MNITQPHTSPSRSLQYRQVGPCTDPSRPDPPVFRRPQRVNRGGLAVPGPRPRRQHWPPVRRPRGRALELLLHIERPTAVDFDHRSTDRRGNCGNPNASETKSFTRDTSVSTDLLTGSRKAETRNLADVRDHEPESEDPSGRQSSASTSTFSPLHTPPRLRTRSANY